MGMKLILLGAPGAGKGTQAEILSAKLGIPTISTGNILRAAIKNATPTGLQAKSYMDAGRLVPDSVVIEIVKERLRQSDCDNGFILDGVPRTLVQAQALEQSGVVFDHVISLEVSDEEIQARMEGRRVCANCGASYHLLARPPVRQGVCDVCGAALVQREDDKKETVQRRLAVYHEQTQPLKGYYQRKGNLREVANHDSIEATTRAIVEALGI
jgi:adenylate kinase